jgi:hypothetical protein
MFKYHNVVPISALRLDSKEPLRKETVPPIRTGTVTACQFGRCWWLRAVRKPKYWRRSRNAPHGAHADEGRFFTCPSAAATTAATHSRAFPAAASANMQATHSSLTAHRLLFDAPQADLSQHLSTVCDKMQPVKTKHLT